MSDTSSDLPTVMIIRHAEKPGAGPDNPHGVDHRGEKSEHGLTPRGWSRAGALAALFARTDLADGTLTTPKRVLATKPTDSHPSRREVDTARPVAGKLGIKVEDLHSRNGDENLVADVVGAKQTALIVWDHGHIPQLARAFPLADSADVPKEWDGDRYDLIWVLTPTAAGYSLTIVAQDLLEGDECAPTT